MVVSYLLSLDAGAEVWVIPTYNHAHSKKMADFNLRMQWIRQAMSIFSDRVKVSSWEMHHQPPNTLTLIKQLQFGAPVDMTLVVGADNYRDRDKWHKWDELAELVDVLVIGRGGTRVNGFAIPEVSSTQIRDAVREGNLTYLKHLLHADVFQSLMECGADLHGQSD